MRFAIFLSVGFITAIVVCTGKETGKTHIGALASLWLITTRRSLAGLMPHRGINLPKRFTNLHILDSSSPQNEKRLSYRKQKSYLGSNMNFFILYMSSAFHFGTSEKSDKLVISLKC